MSRILSNAAHQSIPSRRTSAVSQSCRAATSYNHSLSEIPPARRGYWRSADVIPCTLTRGRETQVRSQLDDVLGSQTFRVSAPAHLEPDHQGAPQR